MIRASGCRSLGAFRVLLEVWGLRLRVPESLGLRCKLAGCKLDATGRGQLHL